MLFVNYMTLGDWLLNQLKQGVIRSSLPVPVATLLIYLAGCAWTVLLILLIMWAPDQAFFVMAADPLPAVLPPAVLLIAMERLSYHHTQRRERLAQQ